MLVAHVGNDVIIIFSGLLQFLAHLLVRQDAYDFLVTKRVAKFLPRRATNATQALGRCL